MESSWLGFKKVLISEKYTKKHKISCLNRSRRKPNMQLRASKLTISPCRNLIAQSLQITSLRHRRKSKRIRKSKMFIWKMKRKTWLMKTLKGKSGQSLHTMDQMEHRKQKNQLQMSLQLFLFVWSASRKSTKHGRNNIGVLWKITIQTTHLCKLRVLRANKTNNQKLFRESGSNRSQKSCAYS